MVPSVTAGMGGTAHASAEMLLPRFGVEVDPEAIAPQQQGDTQPHIHPEILTVVWVLEIKQPTVMIMNGA